MSRTIRTIGVLAMCLTLLVVMTACQSTGAKQGVTDGSKADCHKTGKCPTDCSKPCCAKDGKCPPDCKKPCCAKASAKCGLKGCSKPGNPAIKAMVGGKEACFCCEGCKKKATQK